MPLTNAPSEILRLLDLPLRGRFTPQQGGPPAASSPLLGRSPPSIAPRDLTRRCVVPLFCLTRELTVAAPKSVAPHFPMLIPTHMLARVIPLLYWPSFRRLTSRSSRVTRPPRTLPLAPTGLRILILTTTLVFTPPVTLMGQPPINFLLTSSRLRRDMGVKIFGTDTSEWTVTGSILPQNIILPISIRLRVI